MFDHFAKEKSDFLKKKDKSKKGCIDEDIKEIIALINSKKDYCTTSSCAGRIVLLEMKSRKKNECDWIFTKHDKVNLKEINDALKKYNKNQNPKKSATCEVRLAHHVTGFLGTSKYKNFEVTRELPLKVGRKEETSFSSMPRSIKFIGEASRYYRKSKIFGNARNLRFRHGRKVTPSTIIGEARLNNFNIIKNKNQIWFKQQPIILHVACRNLNAANKLLNVARKIFRRAGIIGITKRKIMVEIIGDERLETIVGDKNFVADENYFKQLIKYANENLMENKRKSERFLRVVKKI